MEQAVRDVCKDIRIGKILIQTNLQTGEPEVNDIFKYLQIEKLTFLFLSQYSIFVFLDIFELCISLKWNIQGDH